MTSFKQKTCLNEAEIYKNCGTAEKCFLFAKTFLFLK